MGRTDEEAHLVTLRHPDLEEQDGIRRWFESCLGNLNAPCDLISMWGGVEKTTSSRGEEPKSFFSALWDFHLSPNEIVFEICLWGQLSIHRSVSIAFPFRLYVIPRG